MLCAIGAKIDVEVLKRGRFGPRSEVKVLMYNHRNEEMRHVEVLESVEVRRVMWVHMYIQLARLL